MIHGDVKEPLYLVAVQIHGQNPVSTSLSNEIGNKLGADRLTPFGLLILADQTGLKDAFATPG